MRRIDLQDEPLVRELAMNAHRLTEEEQEFLHDVGAQVIDRHKLLSEKQRNRLEDIYTMRVLIEPEERL